MSQPCTIQKCERTSRAVCDCCNQNLCLQHLHEHNELLVTQLNPFIDTLNSLGERLNIYDFHGKVRDGHQALEQWRTECHQTIDFFFEQKQKELQHLVTMKIEKQQEKILDIRTKLSKFTREQEVTQRDLNNLSATINRLERDISKIEQVTLSIHSSPLEIDDTIVQIRETNVQPFDASIFSSIRRTVTYPRGSWYSLTSNDQFLLLHQVPNLCLLDTTLSKVKEIIWLHGTLYDMCWSSTLDRFLLLTNDNLFLVGENLLSIDLVQTLPKQKWFSCTCSHEYLYLSTEEWGSSIVQIGLSSPMMIIKEWKSPETCAADEFIESIVYNNGTLVLSIRNRTKKTIRVDLRSTKTFHQIWSFVLHTNYDKTTALRCCSIESNEWLIPDLHGNHLLHVSADGKLIQRITYQPTPYRINQFTSDILAIATETYDDILYDIKWQREITSSLDLANSFIFTSKRKETYSCVLPTTQSTDTTLPDYILNTELESFFQNLHSQAATTCTYRLDPYWTYELCHGMHIRQYHETKVAGKKTMHQEYFLGYYHAASQEKLVNDQDQAVTRILYKTFDNREMPMLEVRYTHGTNCDLNSDSPRETVVLYMCHENGRNGIMSIQEVSSCHYEIVIASPQLCKISAFNLVEPSQYKINCYPHENVGRRPRNLARLEHEHESSIRKSGSAQFTMTNADGTTFIISYQYSNEADVKEMPDNTNSDTSHTVTPSTSSEPENKSPEIVHQEFLQKFLTGEECLTSGSDWWQYEICYGKHVIQFHEENEQRTSILLGLWNREKHIEWIHSNSDKRSNQNNQERQYVSLYYTDGDVCELTNDRRVVEIKLKCAKKHDKSLIATMYLVEPQTCSYVLGVESPVFCDLIDNVDEHGIPDPEKLFERDEET
ncbi:hypothetical protein I4U23_013514 [Adineta vaga]|nr:hypothetical protein I4U23_013514 [Adineta vaga]